MANEKLTRSVEGLVPTAIGAGFLLMSLAIPDNPVPVEGAVGWLSQARALPLILSAAVMLLGIIHTAALWQGKTSPVASQGSRGWTALLVLITTIYLLVIPAVGFLVPTVAYLIAMLLLCGRREGKGPLLLLGWPSFTQSWPCG